MVGDGWIEFGGDGRLKVAQLEPTSSRSFRAPTTLGSEHGRLLVGKSVWLGPPSCTAVELVAPSPRRYQTVNTI